MTRWRHPEPPPGSPKRTGFTLIELLVVITIIGILAAIALPNYIKAKDKAKEVQTKSAVHAVQIATERYFTDFEEYPLFLLGGDVEGWRNWHSKYDEPNPDPLGSNASLKDPLVTFGYVDSYSKNPFVDNGNTVIQSTGNPTGAGGSHQAGDGDPRFGFRGDAIGNGIENPMIFANWYTDTSQNVETFRTLTTVTGGNPAGKGFGVPVGTNRYPSSGGDPAKQGLHYSMGGRRATKVENGQQIIYTAFTHWPGNFFYRGFPERTIGRKGWTIWFPQAFIKASTTRYMLGGFGSYTTEGLDVARLESRTSNGGSVFYSLPPPWTQNNGLFRLEYGFSSFQAQGGMPEMAGGGNDAIGPWLPPDRSTDYPNAFIYGAPDTFKDAIILVLTGGDEVQSY